MPKYTVNLGGRNYDLDSPSELSPNEVMDHFQQAGFDTNPPAADSSFVNSALRNVIPAQGGVAGGMGGAALGTALAPETGGLSLLIPIGMAIAGGLGGYVGGKKIQDVTADYVAPNSLFGTKAEQQDVQENPNASMVGGFFGMGLPNPVSLARAGSSVLTSSGRQALSKAVNLVKTVGPKQAELLAPKEFAALNHVLGIAGNAGVGAAQGIMEGQSPSDIALNTAGMMLFNEGWLHHPSPEINTNRFREAGKATPDDIAKVAPKPPEAVSEPTDTQLEDIAVKASNDPVANEIEQGAEHAASVDAPLTASVATEIAESKRDHEFLKPQIEEVQKQVETEQKALENKPEPPNEETKVEEPVQQPALRESDGLVSPESSTGSEQPPDVSGSRETSGPQPVPEAKESQVELQEYQDALSEAKRLKASKSVIDHLQKRVDEHASKQPQPDVQSQPKPEEVVSGPAKGPEKPAGERIPVGQEVEQKTPVKSKAKKVKPTEEPEMPFADYLKSKNESDTGRPLSKWTKELYASAQKYWDGDKDALDHVPQGLRQRVLNVMSEFRMETPEGLKEMRDFYKANMGPEEESIYKEENKKDIENPGFETLDADGNPIGEEGIPGPQVSKEGVDMLKREAHSQDLAALVSEGKSTAKDVLEHISQTSNKYGELASELLKIGSKEGLSAPIKVKASSESESGRSHYFPGKHEIRMGIGDEGNHETVIHEVLHALTSRKLPKSIGLAAKSGKEYRKSLDKVLNDPSTEQPVKDLIDLYIKGVDAMGHGETVWEGKPGEAKRYSIPSSDYGTKSHSKNKGDVVFQIDHDEVGDFKSVLNTHGIKPTDLHLDQSGKSFRIESKDAQTLRDAGVLIPDQYQNQERLAINRTPREKPTANRPDLGVQRGVPYGLGNLDEFMSEAFSNPKFQKALNDIPGTTKRTLWESFLNAIKKILGMDVKQGSLLEDVLNAIKGVAGLKDSKSFATQARGSSYDAEHPAMPYFYADRAAREKEDFINRGVPRGQIDLMKAFGSTTDHAYAVQATKPMKEFAQSKLFGKIGEPEINSKNTDTVKKAFDSLMNQEGYGASFSKEFQDWAKSTGEPSLLEHKGEVAAGMLQNEIHDYAKKLIAQDSNEVPFYQEVMRRSGDAVLNDFLTTSGGARALQLRSMVSRDMGLDQGLKQLDTAKDEAIDKGFGRGEVAKVQKAVESPTPEQAKEVVDSTTTGPDVDKAALEAQKIVIDEENDMKKPTADAIRIIDSIDKSHTERVIPDKTRNQVRDLAAAALKDARTDTARPGFLGQDRFIKQYSEGFMSLGVEKDAAINLAQRLYGENIEKSANTDRRRLDRIAKGHGVRDLVTWLLSDPANRLADPARIKEQGLDWLRKGGFTEEQASRFYGRYEKLFQSKLNEARIKAFELATEGLKGIQPVTMDKIRTSLRSGEVPDVRDALSKQLGFKGLTNEQVSDLARMDLRLSKAGPSESSVIYREMADILQKASPEMSWSKRVYKSFVNSALSGLSTLGLHYTQPAFATATRVGTEMAGVLSDVARGRVNPTEAPQRIGTVFKDYIESYRGYVNTIKRAYGNDAFTISYAKTLRDLESLSVDMDRQIDRIKNGTPAQKVQGLTKLMFASTDITHKVLLSGVEASARTMQNFFHRRGARRLLEGELTHEEMGKLITEATKHGDDAGRMAELQGKSRSEASGEAIDATNKFIRDAVDEHLGEGKGKELGEYANAETSLETGSRKGEKGAGWDIFNHMAETAKEASYAARRQNELFGRMTMGFVSIPTNLVNRSLAFTPVGLMRALSKTRHPDKANLYKESMGNDLQMHQRIVEGVAGTVGMAAAAALFLGRDQDNPNYTGPRITLYGPKDRNLREAWLKQGNKPGSVEWLSNGKVKFSMNYARGGPESLKLPFISIGALDDMRLNGTLGKENAVEGVGDWLKTLASGGMKEAAFFGMKNLAEIPSMAEGNEKSVASNLAWTGSAFVPWSGFVKSISKIATGAVDQSSVKAALIAQTPFLSLMGKPAVNMLGDQKGLDSQDALTKYSDRASYAGLPFYVGNDPDNRNAKVYSFFLDKGVSPTGPSRANLAQRNGMISDNRFYSYVKTRGSLIKDEVIKNMNELRKMKDTDLESAMRSIENRATKQAKDKLHLK